jgi:hypothetical protein
VRVTKTGNADEPEFGRLDDRDLGAALGTDHFDGIRLRAACKVARARRYAISNEVTQTVDLHLACHAIFGGRLCFEGTNAPNPQLNRNSRFQIWCCLGLSLIGMRNLES